MPASTPSAAAGVIWEPAQLDVLREAVTRARAGTPTLLLVDGDAGSGKTSLLDELERQATGFAVHPAEGVRRDAVPFGVLAQWGADAALHASSPFDAAQVLRDRLGQGAGDGRVLLRLDDAHWADPDSVGALGWLLRRARGDNLLVAVAARRPGAEDRWWHRWEGHASSLRLPLTGLSAASVAVLVQRRHPWAGDDFAARLTEHTGGNPFYLSAILAEHDPVALERMRRLPAPAEFIDDVAARMDRLTPSARALARAAAVLGTGRHLLSDAGAVAGAGDPPEDAQALVDAGWLRVTTDDGNVRVRLAHALVVAAVYQRIPLPERAALHRRAAGVAADRAARLEHLVSATTSLDEALAEDVADCASALHAVRHHRRAAQFQRQAAALTADPWLRRRRMLDAVLEDAFAGDFLIAHAALQDLPEIAGDAYRVAVLACVLSLEGRRAECIAAVKAIDTDVAGLPTLMAFRTYALLSWALYGAGHPSAQIAETVRRAQAVAVDDPAVTPHLLYAAGAVRVRTEGIHAVLAELDEALPGVPTEAADRSTYLLAWRGVVRLSAGLFPEAAADLQETQRRLLAGLTEIADGAFHALLGIALWFDGRWDLARIAIGLAVDRTEAVTAEDPADEVGGVVYPFPHLAAPLGALTTDDPHRADRLLERVGAALERRPWPEAVSALLVVRVVHAHAVGSAAERAAVLPEMRRRWPGFDGGDPLWLLHATLAAVWAGELTCAERYTARLLDAAPRPPWLDWVAAWLRGLVAEARGDVSTALDLLAVATHDPRGMPFYRAHALVDRARLLGTAGQRAAAADALIRAARLYRSLGAPTTYLERVDGVRGATRTPSVGDPLAALTERERDVLALTVSGLSYVQIARDLYITRSTVNYHLSNIYAKAGVAGRHELVELARQRGA